MQFRVEFDPQAFEDFRNLRAKDRAAVLDVVQALLPVQPERTSRSRIKRLRGEGSPQFRLRVGNHRVYYDVRKDMVYVMRILDKATNQRYLEDMKRES